MSRANLAGSADAGGLTGRNLIINGAMQVAQRGTSFTSTSGDTYTYRQFSASFRFRKVYNHSKHNGS